MILHTEEGYEKEKCLFLSTQTHYFPKLIKTIYLFIHIIVLANSSVQYYYGNYYLSLSHAHAHAHARTHTMQRATIIISTSKVSGYNPSKHTIKGHPQIPFDPKHFTVVYTATHFISGYIK